MLNGTANTKFSYLSAACYLFGRDLYQQLGETVPIGLVASDVGGVKIETLMSEDALVDESCGGTAYRQPPASSTAAAAAAGTLGDKSSAPFGSNVWNGMIHPLLPMRFVGVVFYQGESCPGRYSHSDTTLYISLLILHTKYTGARQNDFIVCAHTGFLSEFCFIFSTSVLAPREGVV